MISWADVSYEVAYPIATVCASIQSGYAASEFSSNWGYRRNDDGRTDYSLWGK